MAEPVGPASREQNLVGILRLMQLVVEQLVRQSELDPADCLLSLEVYAAGPDGRRHLATERLSLAEVLAKADALLAEGPA